MPSLRGRTGQGGRGSWERHRPSGEGKRDEGPQDLAIEPGNAQALGRVEWPLSRESRPPHRARTENSGALAGRWQGVAGCVAGPPGQASPEPKVPSPLLLSPRPSALAIKRAAAGPYHRAPRVRGWAPRFQPRPSSPSQKPGLRATAGARALPGMCPRKCLLVGSRQRVAEPSSAPQRGVGLMVMRVGARRRARV